jgi:positive regulator of sigma E activity
LRHGTVLGAASLSYGLLLAGLMAGLVTGYAVGPANDLSTALGGLLGLAAGGATMTLVGRRLRARGRFRSLALPADPSP